MGTSLMIIVIAVSVLAIIIFAYCARMLYVQANIEQFKREAMKAQAEKAVKKGQEIEVEDYVDQYNPANDFAVFGVGDPRGGGMQTLQ